ncbi:MAG: hypothetical protein RR228_04205, partial [Bacilli bacterium]
APLLFIILSFFVCININAATSVSYNESNNALKKYYSTILNRDKYLDKSTGLISKEEYDKTLKVTGLYDTSYLFNAQESLLSNIISNEVSYINSDGKLSTKGKDVASYAKESVYIKKNTNVKGSGTKANPYIFYDESDVQINSIKVNGELANKIPTGNYELKSTCIGGSVSYENNELLASITASPLICNLDFYEKKSVKITFNVHGGTVDGKNESTLVKEIKIGEDASFIIAPKTGYSLENIFVKCDDGTKPLYNSANKTYNINNVTKADTCNVVLQRNVSYSASSVTYTIPFTGNYIINSFGAQGEGNGGKGGYIQVNKRFTKGEVLTILTGGQDGTNGGGAGFNKGGGASSISLNNTKIIVSAGGGGASDNNAGNPGGNGNGSGGSNIGGGAGSSGSNGGGGGSSYNTTACDSGSYSCNYGDSLSGSTCSHFDQYTFGSSAQCSGISPDNPCSPGYSKSYYCDSCAGLPDGTWVSCTGICTSSYFYGASYYPGSCYLYYGYPGNGGTNVVSGVTATINSSGFNAGNGKASIYMIN